MADLDKRVSLTPRFNHPDPRTSALDVREADILRLLGQGRSYGEVAGTLDLAERAVRDHVRSILKKVRGGAVS